MLYKQAGPLTEGVARASAPGPKPILRAIVIESILSYSGIYIHCQARGLHSLIALEPGLTLKGPASRIKLLKIFWISKYK